MPKVRTLDRANLVGEWKLDGNALDTSGSGNNGTATNVTHINTGRGYQSQAGVFNGSNARITFSRASPGAVTNSYSCWFQRIGTGTGEEQLVFFGGTSGTKGTVLRAQAGTLQYITGSFSAWQTIQSVSNSLWYHCVITQGSGGSKAYINNVLIATNVSDTNTLAGTQASAIGSNGNAAQDYFNGYIQGVRTFNSELSPQEIQSLYMEGMRKLSGSSLVPLTDGLIAYYDFNGDANDIIGGNNGTVTAATLTTNNRGESNKAYSFNGSSANINIPNSTPLQLLGNYTQSIWVYQSGAATQRLIQKDNSNDYSGGWGIQIYSNLLATDHNYGSNQQFATGITIPTNTWTHILQTYDGANRIVYINGVSSATKATTTNVVGEAGNNVFIGCYGDTSPIGQYYTGSIGEVMLFSRALSASEVLALYQISSQRYLTPLLF